MGGAAIEHFAKTAWIGRWRDGQLVMLTACFDASGHPEQQKSLVVAGFVATPEQWIDFDMAWRKRLAEDSLPYFHMQEFAQFSGPFSDGWRDNESRRRALLSSLYDIIFTHAFRKFGTAVVNAQLTAIITKLQQRNFFTTAYGISGRGVIHNVIRWASVEGFSSVEFVFENGDLNKGHLLKLVEKDGLPTPSFKPKQDTKTSCGLTIPGFSPLQAADILAYEYRLILERPPHSPRWGYTQFDKMPGEVRKYSWADLRRIRTAMSAGEAM